MGNAGNIPTLSRGAVTFGTFCLQPASHLLFDSDTPVRIGARALGILIALVERRGEVVTKEQLFELVWRDVNVDESNLRTQLASLRKVLREGENGARYIVTVPRRGYRFVAAVTSSEGPIPPDPQPLRLDTGFRVPPRITRLIGRDDAVADIAGRLQRHRFVTIIGPGGIGKTSVAWGVIERTTISYSDGSALVDCAALIDTSSVARKLASTLGLDIASDDPTQGLVAYLRGRRMLIVFDCCERVVEAAAVLAEVLLKGGTNTSILATSREPLRAEGESIYRLPPLEIPPGGIGLTADDALAYPAVQLFIERAAYCDDQFQFRDSDAAVVAEICRKLDGIALAIELAAGRVDVFGLVGVAARLEDRVRLLTHGRRTALPRHQTLAATLDWSYDALSEPDKAVLRRLSVFLGEFTLDAAQAVASDESFLPDDVAEIVASLISKSLINSDVSSGIGRYRLLDTTRAYALGKLDESGELGKIARVHASYVHAQLHKFGSHASASPSANISAWLPLGSKLIEEARAVIDWSFSPGGDISFGVALTVAAIPIWTQLSLNGECCRYVQNTLVAGDSYFSDPDTQKMQLLTALGASLVWTKGPGPDAEAAFLSALDLAEKLNDRDYQIRILWGLWSSHFNSGRIQKSLETARRFRDVSVENGDSVAALVGERTIGMSLFYLGDYAGSRAHAETMLARYARPPDRSHIIRFQFDPRVVSRTLRSKLLWGQGFPDQALREVRGVIEEAQAVGHPMSLALALAQGACPVTLLCGEWNAADDYIRLLAEHAVEHALGLWHEWASCFGAMLLIGRGDTDQGTATLCRILKELPQDAFFVHYAGIHATMAEALGNLGEISKGHITIDKALMRADRDEERWYLAEFLRIKGELFRFEGTAVSRRKAEEQYKLSINCAERQKALSWQLRTSISLAKLYQSQSRSEAARKILLPVYGCFKEGYDSFDLTQAKALLEELR